MSLLLVGQVALEKLLKSDADLIFPLDHHFVHLLLPFLGGMVEKRSLESRVVVADSIELEIG